MLQWLLKGHLLCFLHVLQEAAFEVVEVLHDLSLGYIGDVKSWTEDSQREIPLGILT